MKKPEKQEVKKAQKQESIQDGVKDLETYTHYYIPHLVATNIYFIVTVACGM